ncbi:hypothetical protein CHARACLAT_001952 [Characodon lateralis]|uniref:Uncharacterized protein n=1 Tax=Characodon lateralis TaxID=208331 RepID=A0ABU7D3C9_9TELE|nr:hypothetical protein [Characodon lateralis]
MQKLIASQDFLRGLNALFFGWLKDFGGFYLILCGKNPPRVSYGLIRGKETFLAAGGQRAHQSEIKTPTRHTTS